MKLQVFIGNGVIEIDIDPSQKSEWDDKLKSAVLGCGVILQIGTASIPALRISYWRFVEDIPVTELKT